MKASALFSSLALVGAFVPPSDRGLRLRARPFGSANGASVLFAEGGGAPQYEKRNGILRQAEVVGEGSVMLHIETVEATAVNGQDDQKAAALTYYPGHVLALEIKDETAEDTEDETSNGGGDWMRGPYTISRATDTTVDVLIKVVGSKSKTFASAEPGTSVKFGGQFKVPIVQGICSTSSKRVVLISTGVGVGPCVGAVEQLLLDRDNENHSFSGKVDLVASFRTQPEVVYEKYLNTLANEQKQFQYKPWISSEVGRISASDESLRAVIGSTGICTVSETHYHLIGNGQLVNEWKAGLAQAGVPQDKVTTEAYFNHNAKSNKEATARIASIIAEASLNPAVVA